MNHRVKSFCSTFCLSEQTTLPLVARRQAVVKLMTRPSTRRGGGGGGEGGGTDRGRGGAVKGVGVPPSLFWVDPLVTYVDTQAISSDGPARECTCKQCSTQRPQCSDVQCQVLVRGRSENEGTHKRKKDKQGINKHTYMQEHDGKENIKRKT